MEVYFLKKLILHRSDIRGRNESQNIEGCSEAKLQEPLLIPPFAPPKPISFYPSPFLSAQDQFQPIMAHFPPPFSWPKPKPNAATHFLFFPFPFLSPTCPSLPPFLLPCCQPLPTATLPPAISPLSHHFPFFSPMQTPITPLAHHFPIFPLLVSCMNSPLNTLPTCKPAAKTSCWQPLEDPSVGYKSH